MKFLADLHIHSKYSRATSQNMDVESLAKWANIKGIALMGTGDFTHPLWLDGLKRTLAPLGNGLFKHEETCFILSAEVSNIFHQGGFLRKIHQVILAPSFELVDELNQVLKTYGNLKVDGRPTFLTPVSELVRQIFKISSEFLVIPAHIWTPHFSLFGSNSGFNSLEECYGEFSPHITAVETGLSSDPEMNWRLSQLDDKAIVSFSDAHSPAKIGREACCFETDLSYQGIREALEGRNSGKLLYTIEFFPEEGKYHYTGHRGCGVVQSPEETKEKGILCPVCRKKLTVGVMHRVEELADRPQGFKPEKSPPFKNLIPLEEIIAEALGVQVQAASVKNEYFKFTNVFKNEFAVLLEVPVEDLIRVNPRVAEGIRRVREGRVNIFPGYDGVYGKIKIFEEEKESAQLNLFS